MDASAKNVFGISFNQDFSCFSIGTKKEGYKLFNVDSFGKIHSHANGGYGIVEMLFCTSLVALVGLGDQPELSPRRLQIVNTKRQSTICELTFPTSILAIRLNRKRLVAVLEQQIYVYDISNMKLLHTIETSPNPNAVCDLSASSENCYLAYPSPTPSPASSSNVPAHSPGSTTYVPVSGDVLIFDTLSMQPVNVAEAHKSPLASISLNAEGTLLATASDKGTIIRVFSVPQAQKLFQFRRGTLPAKIHSMNFNLASTFLTVSSGSETVHVFKLSHDQERFRDEDDSVSVPPPHSKGSKRGPMGMIRKQSQSLGRSFAGTFGSYLPNSVTEIWEPMRDFAKLRIPTGNAKTVVAMSNSQSQVMVITSGGQFLLYDIDLDHGGDCVLAQQYSLLDVMN